MAHLRILAALVLVAALTTGSASADATPSGSKAPAHAAKPDTALASEAKVSMAAAKATALARVPGGKVKSSELEREKGKLIYSFDIVVAGKSGIEEVNVDAITGRVLSVQHEGPKAERKEAEQEKAEAHGDSVKAKAHADSGKTAKPPAQH
jgi:uncharacterized membrane protein YkoI